MSVALGVSRRVTRLTSDKPAVHGKRRRYLMLGQPAYFFIYYFIFFYASGKFVAAVQENRPFF